MLSSSVHRRPAQGSRRTPRCATRAGLPKCTGTGESAPCRSTSTMSTSYEPPRRLLSVEVDVLDVLAAASVVARAVAVDVESALGRSIAAAGQSLVTRSDEREVHVRRGGVPRDRELQEAGLQPAAFVDDAVAVVVDRVEAELRPGRRACHGERRPGGRCEVRCGDVRRWSRRPPAARTTDTARTRGDTTGASSTPRMCRSGGRAIRDRPSNEG